MGSKFYGVDYNPILINWCRKNLPFAEYTINKLSSRLKYESNKFDFIYVISVFTHLTEGLWFFWINELTRVLKPGGYLLITIQGSTRMYQLDRNERKVYESSQIVMKQSNKVGTNFCGAFHSEKYVCRNIGKDLVVVDFIPGGARDANQDAYLLRKIL